MSTVEELTTQINATAEKIRSLKAEKAAKEIITENVNELLRLKEAFKAANGGVPFDPPKVEEPKKEKKAPEPAPEREGPSKKELNKAAKKEKKANASDPPSAPASVASASSSAAPTPTPVVKIAATSTAAATATGVVFSNQIPPPVLTLTVAALLKLPLTFSVSQDASAHLPYLAPTAGSASNNISGDATIARHLLRTSPAAAGLYGGVEAWSQGEIDTWLDVYTSLYGVTDEGLLRTHLLSVLEGHLRDRTLLVGTALSLADVALFLLSERSSAIIHRAGGEFVHVARWSSHVRVELTSQTSQQIVNGASQANSSAGIPRAAAGVFTTAANLLLKLISGASTTSKSASDGKTIQASASAAASAASAASSGPAGESNEGEDGSICPPLEGAIEGQVCTRFPPEPSGYLHIGHAKAVLLNQYYAQRYKGRLLVRFDDTNPSKEKDEFAENIIQDLKTLGVHPDSVSHTSDHFKLMEDLARKMITSGHAYMDNTDQETMQAERMERKESRNRSMPIAESLTWFEALLKGEKEAQKYCLRAKIDMSSVNGTMRDPVMYRFNETPHLRTGTQFKAYPTYDFACPIVDSIEGVSHALRTTEYNDRDEQYHWIQNALGLRHVHIQAFGKMNFVHTVLSKRKLNWFVEQGHVEGWFDPRFPTVQGCIRRGVNVEALKAFILSQGASRRVITMEWDKFWAENKRVLEETAPRFMAIAEAGTGGLAGHTNDVTGPPVSVYVTNLGGQKNEAETVVSVNVNPLKPEQGLRAMRRSSHLLLDQEDAVTYKEGEEVTFLRWGNFILDKIEKDATTGVVTSITARFNFDATNFSKTKKTTWLSAGPDLVPLEIHRFDHLISKAKLSDEEDFKDFVNPLTRFVSRSLGDAALRLVPAGTVVQLERKGFFRVDKPYGGSADKPAILFAIPDGKTEKTVGAPAPAAGASKKK